MFISFGPSESHKPLQYLRVFVPQEPISTSLRKIAPPWRTHVLEQVVHGRAGAQAHTLQIRAVCFREEVSRRLWAFEFPAVGMGLRVNGIHMVLKAVGRCEMARAVSTERGQDRKLGLGHPTVRGLGREQEPAAETRKEWPERLEKANSRPGNEADRALQGEGARDCQMLRGGPVAARLRTDGLGLARRRPLEMLTGALSMKWWGVKTRLEWV